MTTVYVVLASEEPSLASVHASLGGAQEACGGGDWLEPDADYWTNGTWDIYAAEVHP